MKRLLWICCITFWAQNSPAQEIVRVGVIAVEAKQSTAGVRQIAEGVTRKLRSIIRGQRRWQEVWRLGTTAADLRTVLECPTLTLDCMKEVPETLGLNLVFWGILSRDSASVQLFGVSINGQQKQTQIRLTRGQLSENGFEEADQFVQSFIPRTRLSIMATPYRTAVQLNRKRVGVTPITLELKAGLHQLEFTASGYASQTREIRIRHRPTQDLDITLQPLSSTMQSTTLSEEPPSDTLSRDITRWTSLGVAVSTGILASVLLVKRNSVADTADNILACEASVMGCQNGKRTIVSQAEF